MSTDDATVREIAERVFGRPPAGHPDHVRRRSVEPDYHAPLGLASPRLPERGAGSALVVVHEADTETDGT